mgnify:CR=1 FL=1
MIGCFWVDTVFEELDDQTLWCQAVRLQKFCHLCQQFCIDFYRDGYFSIVYRNSSVS